MAAQSDKQGDPGTPGTSRGIWSISNWPIARKVAVVLAVPVLLATVFGGLRVQDALDEAAQYGTAETQAQLLQQIFAIVGAAQDQAILFAGSPDDIDTTEYEALIATAREGLDTSELPFKQRSQLTDAINAGDDLLDLSVRGTVTPKELFAPLRELEKSVQSYLETVDAQTERPEPELPELSSFLEGQVALTEQQIVLASGNAAAQKALDAGDKPPPVDPVLRATVLSSVGRESAALDGLKLTDPKFVSALKTANEERLNDLAENTAPTESLQAAQESRESYNALSAKLAAEIAATLSKNTIDTRASALRDASIVLGALLAALALALLVAGSLVRPIRMVRRAALEVATNDLPEAVQRIRVGEDVPEPKHIAVDTQEETGQLARAVEDMHRQALHLAGEQARLRGQVNDMFETLSRRSSSLIGQQLSLIDDLERDEEDSERLGRLFRLDHLAARMRRNGQSLLVLAGANPRTSGAADLPLADVLRAAMSEVEGYERLGLEVSSSSAAIAGSAAADLAHLFAELMDNALAYSPPTSEVDVQASRAWDAGYLVEIRDSGLGMPAQAIEDANRDLESGGEVTVGTARRMGLFVVGRLAQRHGVSVRLRANSSDSGAGVTASVHLPAALVRAMPRTGSAPEASEPSEIQPQAGADERASLATVTGLPQRGRADTEVYTPLSARPSAPATIAPAAAATSAMSSFTSRVNPSYAAREEAAPAASAHTSSARPQSPYAARPQSPYAAPPGDTASRPSEAGSVSTGAAAAAPADATAGTANGAVKAGDTPKAADGVTSGDTAAKAGDTAVKAGDTAAKAGDTAAKAGDTAAKAGDTAVKETAPAPAEAKGPGGLPRRKPGASGAGSGILAAGSSFGALTPPTEAAPAPTPSRPAPTPSGLPSRPTPWAGTNGSSAPVDGARPGSGSPRPAAARPSPAGPPAARPGPAVPPAARPAAAASTPAARTPAPTVKPENENGRAGIDAFFAAKPQNLASTWATSTSTPIFQNLRSKWLQPDDGSDTDGIWATPEIDQGWQAAEAAVHVAPTTRTAAGLPSRRPGSYLVPGSAEVDVLDDIDRIGPRDPVRVRSSLSSHMDGVRRGRVAAQNHDDTKQQSATPDTDKDLA